MENIWKKENRGKIAIGDGAVLIFFICMKDTSSSFRWHGRHARSPSRGSLPPKNEDSVVSRVSACSIEFFFFSNGSRAVTTPWRPQTWRRSKTRPTFEFLRLVTSPCRLEEHPDLHQREIPRRKKQAKTQVEIYVYYSSPYKTYCNVFFIRQTHALICNFIATLFSSPVKFREPYNMKFRTTALYVHSYTLKRTLSLLIPHNFHMLISAGLAPIKVG